MELSDVVRGLQGFHQRHLKPLSNQVFPSYASLFRATAYQGAKMGALFGVTIAAGSLIVPYFRETASSLGYLHYGTLLTVFGAAVTALLTGPFYFRYGNRVTRQSDV